MSLARTTNFFSWSVMWQGIFNPPGMNGEHRRLPHSFSSASQKIPRQNSVHRWPTVLLFFRITTAMPNLSVNQGHGSQQRATVHSRQQSLQLQWKMFTHESLHGVSYIGEISVLSVALTSLQIDPSHFSSSWSSAFDVQKCSNSFEREGKWFFTHSN